MENARQREVISQKLERQLRYMILDESNADRTILFLLEHNIGLETLIFCRYHVQSSDLAAELEERLLEESFRPFMIVQDLIAIEERLSNLRLKQKLYSLAESLVDGKRGYFPFCWLIIEKYPDLTERTGEYLLAYDLLDVPQIGDTIQYFSKDLQERLIERIRIENQYSVFEIVQKYQ